VQAIRAAIQNLTVQVIPWIETKGRAGHPQGAAATPGLPLWLGGGFLVGLLSLVTAYLMQRRTGDYGRQRRGVLVAARRWQRSELTSETPALPAGQQDLLPEGRPSRSPPTAVVRHVRVSHRMRRRIRLYPTSQHPASILPSGPAHARSFPRRSPSTTSAAVELVEALASLRQVLLGLQRQLPPAPPPEHPEFGPKRRLR
jgi:hypothetical protein